MDYENFVTDLTADREFLEGAVSEGLSGNVRVCVLVRQKGRKDGVLVVPTEDGFVTSAAYAPAPDEAVPDVYAMYVCE